MLDDIRLAWRRLARTPAFTAIAVLTLVLGVGATSAVYSVVHAVLLKPLPFRDPDSLYLVWTRHPSTDRYPFQLPEFCDYRDQHKSLEGFAGYANFSAGLRGDGLDTTRIAGLRVTGDFFEVLGARAALGRTLRAADDTPGQEKVVVLAHGAWQRHFGGDPAVVGRSVVLNGDAFTIVGVLGSDFPFPVRSAEIAIPLAPELDPWRHDRRSTNFIRAVARARPGVDAGEIAADLESIGRRLAREYPERYAIKQGVRVAAYADELTRDERPVLLVLQGSVALLLLIAAANLGNLVLLRATERHGEIAIRQALGAPRGKVVRLVLAEAGVLGVLGAAGALIVVRWGVPVLVALGPDAMPRASEIGVSPAVLLFTLAVSAAVSLGAAWVPVARVLRANPQAQLRLVSRGGVRSPDGARTQAVMVTAQVALMVVLLAAAGSFLRSFREVLRVEPGFDKAALTVRLSLPKDDYGRIDRMSAFYREAEARLRALPGVLAVGAVNHVPLNGALASSDYKPATGADIPDDRLPTTSYRMATPAFFDAIGIPILTGRAFDDGDVRGALSVAIVSASLAREAFPGRDPVGEDILVRDGPAGFRPLRIVGVAGDVRHGGLERETPEPHLYVPYHQTPENLLVFLSASQYLVVRTGQDPLALADAIRRELRGIDASVATSDFRPSGWYVDSAAAGRRFAVQLVGVFAMLAVALAATGIYGVMSYSVTRRGREIGVRRALGADPRAIAALVLGEGLRRTAIGALLGGAGAVAAGIAFRGVLFRTPPMDPALLGGTLVLLVVVTVTACVVPARRAARVDPAVALRTD